MVGIFKKIIKNVRNYFKLLNQRKLKKCKKKSDAVRWGIIGLGKMANCFANYLECSDSSRIVAVASRDINKAERFKTIHRAERAYGSYEELLQQKDIDIVYIATPYKQHYENILSCFEHNKNLLCEKPFVSSINEMVCINKMIKGSSLFVMDGMWMYYLPTLQIAHEWIQNGKIGSMRHIIVDFSRKLSHYTSTGVLYDYGVYAIAFAVKYMGNNIKVEKAFVKKSKNIDFEWYIELSDNVVTAEITLSCLKDGSQTAEILGDDGSIIFNAPFNRTDTIRLLDVRNNIVLKKKFLYKLDGFEFEIQNAQNAVSIQKVSERPSLYLTEIYTRLLSEILTSAKNEEIINE